MSLDDILERVRSGRMRMVARYHSLEERAQIILSADDHTEVNDRFMNALEEHQGLLYLYVFLSDIRVCTDVLAHKPSHVPATCPQGDYIQCEECARIRRENEPTYEETARNPTIDFQEKRKR